jgi:hypothetical protein
VKDTEIDNHLKVLKNKPLVSIGRASNMLWIGFGELIEVRDYRDRKVIKSTLSLHVQCSWRITNKKIKTILFAHSDIYDPNTYYESIKDFNWDLAGNNLFDEKSKEWFNANAALYVEDYRINRWGDLCLLLSNDDVIEVFVDSSSNTECWRLFEYNKEEGDFIVTGRGVMFY